MLVKPITPSRRKSHEAPSVEVAYISLGRRLRDWIFSLTHPHYRAGIYLMEGDGYHTRVHFLMLRLANIIQRARLPKPLAYDFSIWVYSKQGKLLKHSSIKRWNAGEDLVLFSEALLDEPAQMTEALLLVELKGIVFECLGFWENKRQSRRLCRQINELTHDISYFKNNQFITTVHAYNNTALGNGVVVALRDWVDYGARHIANGILKLLKKPYWLTSGFQKVFYSEPFAGYGISSAYAIARPKSESYFVLPTFRRPIRFNDYFVELRNHKGRFLRAALPPQNRFSVSRLRLKDLFPQAGSFLEGQEGQLVFIGFLPGCGRVMVGEIFSDGSFGSDHSVYQFLSWREKPGLHDVDRTVLSCSKGPVNPWMLYHDPSKSIGTYAIIANCIVPEKTKILSLRAYDAEGNLIFKKEGIPLPAFAQVNVPVSDWLLEAGIQKKVIGMYEVGYTCPEDKNELYPYLIFIANTYRFGEKMSACIQSGSAYWNSASAGGLPLEILNRLDRKADVLYYAEFGSLLPIWMNDEIATFIALSNVSHDWHYDLSCEVSLSLYTGISKISEKTAVIPPNGTLYFNVEDFFGPEAVAKLRNNSGFGSLVKRSLDGRGLAVVYLYQQKSTGIFSAEHSLSP